MTLKQQKLLEELPENHYNISKSAKKAGYSDYTATSSIYGLVRNSKNFKEVFSEDYIRRQYKKTLKQAEKSKDLTNKLRALEGMARIKSLFNDKSTVDNHNPDKVTIIYANKQANSIDTKEIQQVDKLT